ncbi:hypothetical protein LTR37_004081 [Vermiconidia calcicola]|uniref:Uncharacterized protein n=1 Tax=Vermiconidia calcicola TaxID=1690605 RepID=A0ACC3NMY1_9PEZI|nr:hypothetical protein LTR37_004081 [Vermiconidia calcicola]
MAIGRDVYLDSRMIIQRLEQLFPPSEQHPAFSSKATVGLAALLNKFTVDASLFRNAVSIMSPDFPVFADAAFVKDRADFFGKGWKADDLKQQRPEGLVHVRQCFDITESLFADDRLWVGATEKPTLADLEGVWSIDWIISDLAPPKEYFSEDVYPKTYSWRNRFKTELEKARARAPKPTALQGSDAVQAVLGADFSDKDQTVDANDPTQVKVGTTVELFPTDGGGFTHKDKGRLIKLTKDEVAIAVESEKGSVEVHVHAPRWNFRISEARDARL